VFLEGRLYSVRPNLGRQYFTSHIAPPLGQGTVPIRSANIPFFIVSDKSFTMRSLSTKSLLRVGMISFISRLSTKSLFRVGMISFISRLSTVTRAQRALFMPYQWLSEFVTQYWFSMYCGSREIQSLTNIVPRSTEQSGSSGSSLYECSISYSTFKRSFAPRI